jgi:SAM-dependent methyltransferase
MTTHENRIERNESEHPMTPPEVLSPADRLAERLYPGCRTGQPSPVDGTVAFYRATFERLRPGVTLLDFGAGRGTGFERHRAPAVTQLLHLAPKVLRRIGVDVDPRVQQNPALDEAYLLKPEDDYRIPLPAASVDAILADWVLEHLPNPLASFAECHRVLRQGGLFAARTPNGWHYSYVVSRTVGSTALGPLLLRVSQPFRAKYDVYPTHYRANTPRTVRKLLAAAGFRQIEVCSHEPEPAYLMFSRPTLLLGWAYERAAHRGFLPRASLFVFATA